MSFLFKRAESRSISYGDVWSKGGDVSLFGDSMSSSLKVAAVYAATSLIADMIASTPWAVFDDAAGYPKKWKQQPTLVTDPGFRGLDVYSWKYQMATSCLLRGNAYGYILDWDARGIPSKVVWLKPDDVVWDDDEKDAYWKGKLIPADQLIHIPGYVVPGSRIGLSPLALFKIQIETAREAQKFGKNFFRRGAVPASILSNTQMKLDPEQAEVIKKRAIASVSSSEPLVIGNDWKFEAISIPQGEVQFLAGIKATANQIAAVYRVDPEDVGGETGGSTLKYASLEMNQLAFAARTLRPWASRFETVLSQYLPPSSRYIRFNLDAAARADLKSRYEAHSIALAKKPFKVVDEVRSLEELPPSEALTQEQFTNGAVNG